MIRRIDSGVLRRLHYWPASALIVAICAIKVLIACNLAFGEEHASGIDGAGTLHVPQTTFPISEFISPELKQAYLEVATGALATLNDTMPAMDAPKSDWDRFFAASDRGFADAIARELKDYSVDIVETKIGGVRVGVISPKNGVAPANRGRVLINLHGGVYHGLILGQVESIPIASIGKIKVITLDYRQEPYYKYPASSEDVADVYQELLKKYKPSAIGIFGSSFGGILTSQAVAWIQGKGLPRPGAVGIFWSGLAAAPFPFGAEGDSAIWANGVIPQGDHAAFDKLMKNVSWYLSGVSSGDAQAYPGSSDAVLAKFPPTLFLTGTRALDMSPAIVGHARLLKLGVNSYLYVMEGGWHGASGASAPEAKDANTYISHWFNQHLTQ